MGQKGRSIRQIRENFQKDWTVGKGRVPGGNCTDRLSQKSHNLLINFQKLT